MRPEREYRRMAIVALNVISVRALARARGAGCYGATGA